MVLTTKQRSVSFSPSAALGSDQSIGKPKRASESPGWRVKQIAGLRPQECLIQLVAVMLMLPVQLLSENPWCSVPDLEFSTPGCVLCLLPLL